MTEAPSPGPGTAPPRIRCRAIAIADGAALAGLLTRGFPDRTRAYWDRAVGRLLAHAALPGVPGCGAVIEAEGEGLVGVLLLIYAADGGADATPRRCNLSSWYVEPRFSAYGALLAHQAMRHKGVTYFNISPAPHTWATIEAQGFSRYSRGRLVVVAAMMPPRPSARVALFDGAAAGHEGLSAGDADRLRRHVDYGCLALVVATPVGPEPFLFLPWAIKGRMPCAQLIHCRDIGVFAHVAGPIGRFLMRRGLPLVTVDLCDGPPPGLVGLPIPDRSPKYARGGRSPASGDLADTEWVMFGP